MAAMESSQSALIPTFILIGIYSFAGGAVGLSTNIYLIEQYVCHEHYDIFDPQSIQHGGLIDEGICKLPEIQSKVAQINGAYTSLSFVPGICSSLQSEMWYSLLQLLFSRAHGVN